MLVYIFCIVTAAVAAAVLYYQVKPVLSHKHRLLLGVLRGITVALLLLFLLTPVVNYIRRYTEKPLMVLLRDTSASMNISGKGKAVTASLNDLAGKYAKQGYKVKTVDFAAGINGKSNGTLLTPVLQKLRESYANLSGILLFSDGWFRDTDLSIIRNYDIPISAVADTTSLNQFDVEVSALRHNRQGYKNEVSLFEADVKATSYKGTAYVTLLIDGKTVAHKQVSFASAPVQTVSFDYRFTTNGLHRVEAQIKTTQQETLTANNQYPDAIEILNDKETILLLTDQPNWDIRFLLDTIRQNNRWQPLSYISKSSGLYSGADKVNLTNWESISTIIIINAGGLSLADNVAASIRNKVNSGTGLLYAGLPVSNLSDILPLKASNIQSRYNGLLQFTTNAQSYAAFQVSDAALRQIPPVDYYYLAPNGNADIIAHMDNPQSSPAIAISRLTSGKVVSIALLGLWQWQMQSADNAYRNMMTGVITWLSNRDSGIFNPVYQSSYLLGEPIDIRLAAADETHKFAANLSPRITIKDKANKTVFEDYLLKSGDEYTIAPNLTAAGDYHFTIADAASKKSISGAFVIQPRNREERDLGYNLPLLNWITSQTQGHFLTLAAAQSYSPVKAQSLQRISRREFPLYKKWYLISLFIISFCAELFFRRRWGLL